MATAQRKISSTFLFTLSLLTGSVSAITPAKKFYPKFQKFFRDAYEPCFEEYGAALRADQWVCVPLTDCILTNMPEVLKASVASTGVFLGFIPTILSYVGPSIKDIALLSTERPILAVLCAVGTAGFGFDKPFLLHNVRGTVEMFLDERVRLDLEDRYFPAMKRSSWLAISLTVLQYVFGCAAVGNTIHNSYQLGTQTVVAFNCYLTPRLPLVYSTFSLVIYALSMLSLWWSLGYLKAREVTGELTPLTEAAHRTKLTWVEREITLSCAATPTEYTLDRKISRSKHVLPSIILGWLADAVMLAQYIMGTVVLSSILFVRLDDAVSIALRYILSAMVCRFIVAFELEGMKQARANLELARRVNFPQVTTKEQDEHSGNLDRKNTGDVQQLVSEPTRHKSLRRQVLRTNNGDVRITRVAGSVPPG